MTALAELSANLPIQNKQARPHDNRAIRSLDLDLRQRAGTRGAIQIRHLPKKKPALRRAFHHFGDNTNQALATE
jgi:hypothetical protein